MCKVVTIIQARMGSSRLPGKVMMSLYHQPLLLRLLERIQRSRLAGTIVVATTAEPDDDMIETVCRNAGVLCFRGNTLDLLDRHYMAALEHNADAVVKIPSDCPLIDPRIIDRVIGAFLAQYPKYDYYSNLHPATYPDGNDVEIMSIGALERAWKCANRQFEREHTTPYIWENPERFTVGNIVWDGGLNYAMTHRWTIDYLEDYLFIKSVFDELYPQNPNFGFYDILNLINKKPHLSKFNAQYNGVNWYRHHLNELKTISSGETRII